MHFFQYLSFKYRDAGVALAAYLTQIVSQPDSTSALGLRLRKYNLKAIELGSGCGIVGLQIARLCPSSDVLLTDLEEGMDVLNYNISKARFSSTKGKIASTVLDWDEELSSVFDELPQFDVIIVSDCTYNVNSLPALVRTIKGLFAVSPGALLIVSMKVRHESEAIFHELIAGAQLQEISHSVVPLPDRTRRGTEQEIEKALIYLYSLKLPSTIGEEVC